MPLSLDPPGTRADLLAARPGLSLPGAVPVLLVAMDVFDAPIYWWTGEGDVEALGQTWTGAGQVVSISEITTGHVDGATSVDFGIVGDLEYGELRDLRDRLIAQPDGVIGRACHIYLGVMDIHEPFGPGWLFTPTALFISRRMASPRLSARMGEDGMTLRISVTAEGPFTALRKPGYGTYSDAAFKARASGDQAGEYLGEIAKGAKLEPPWRR